MMKDGAVERYARALFDLAVEEKQVDRFEQELNEIQQLLNSNADLEKLLYHPRVQENDKKDLMKKILGTQVSPLILNFIMLTIDKGRVDLLKGIITYFKHLTREAKGIVEVQVQAAFELTPENRTKLVAKLKQLTGREIDLKETVDPSLIGGMRMRIGDKVIDGSIQRHLERIKENLAQIQVSQLGVS